MFGTQELRASLQINLFSILSFSAAWREDSSLFVSFCWRGDTHNMQLYDPMSHSISSTSSIGNEVLLWELLHLWRLQQLSLASHPMRGHLSQKLKRRRYALHLPFTLRLKDANRRSPLLLSIIHGGMKISLPCNALEGVVSYRHDLSWSTFHLLVTLLL